MSDLAEELLAEGLDRIESTEKKGS